MVCALAIGGGKDIDVAVFSAGRHQCTRRAWQDGQRAHRAAHIAPPQNLPRAIQTVDIEGERADEHFVLVIPIHIRALQRGHFISGVEDEAQLAFTVHHMHARIRRAINGLLLAIAIQIARRGSVDAGTRAI